MFMNPLSENTYIVEKKFKYHGNKISEFQKSMLHETF